jgi:hypothetical protein
MVSPLILGPVLELGKSLLERFFPDEEERRKAEADFLRSAMDGELKQTIAQLEINAREAVHPSIWVSGWRPFFGWSSGCAFLYATILQPLLAWHSILSQIPPPPDLNIDLLWVVTTCMLGIGSLRTYEKQKGVSK